MSLLIEEPAPRCEGKRSLFGHRFKLVKFTRSQWECVWCGKDRDENDKEVYSEKKTSTQHEPESWPSRHFRFEPADEFLSRGRSIFPRQMGDE